MNDKIKELALKSMDSYPSFDNIARGQYSNSQYNSAIEQMMTMFAELIVQECIEQIETCFAGGSVSMDDKPIWNPSVDTFKAWNWGLKCSRKHIKEVFGVK